MSATSCVPQTTHTEGKQHSSGDGQYYWKQQEVVPLCFFRRYMQTAKDFSRILNNKSNKAETLTTAERKRISRKLLCKMPIISVNLANIIHTQFNNRVVTEIWTSCYQYVVI